MRNLQTANADGALAAAFSTLVGGTFLIGFVQYLGGSDLWIQALVALPSFVGLLQIPGAIWGRRSASYKRFVAPGGWLWRVLYGPLIVLPLAPWPNDVKLWVLAACIALATAATQLVTPIYNDWIAELVPADSRGWYFSRRTAVTTAVAMGISFIGGVLLDQFQKGDRSGPGFSILFGMGLVCALASMAFFLRMRDTVRTNTVQAGVRESLVLMAKPAKDREFQKVLVFTVVFIAGATIAGGLYVAFARESLGLSWTAIQLTQVAHAVGTVAFSNMWGYLADKYGSKPVFVILMVGAFLTPFVWLVCTPGHPVEATVYLVIGHVFNGLVWSGIAVCQMNLYIATSPPEDRANYLGMVFAVQAAVGGIAPLIGGLMMGAFRSSMPLEHAYKAIFLVVMLIRIVAFLVLLPVREEGSSALGQTLGQLGRVNPRGIRALRRLTRTGNPAAKAEAIREVGSAQMPLASAELLRALQDPSPTVRRHAARALGRLDDPSAAMALARFVETNRELVEEETLDALGDMGSPETAPIVATFLSDPRSPLRRQAAKTLGRLGSDAFLDPLQSAANDTSDPDLRRASIQALRLIGADGAQDVFSRALLDPHPSVRSAAAEAVSELKLTALAQPLRDAIQVYGDAYSGELAYALGTVGSEVDLPTLIECAERAESPTTRRRCLLGMAVHFGVEHDLYRLMNLRGFSRDQELVSLLRPVYVKSKRLREAVQSFSLGQETAALDMLCGTPRTKVLLPFKGLDVPELFLVAALVYVKRA